MVHFIPPDTWKATNGFVDLTWNLQRSAIIFLQTETPLMLTCFYKRKSIYLFDITRVDCWILQTVFSEMSFLIIPVRSWVLALFIVTLVLMEVLKTLTLAERSSLHYLLQESKWSHWSGPSKYTMAPHVHSVTFPFLCSL